MRLLDSSLYNADLKKAVSSIDLSSLDGKSFFITGGLGLIASTVVDVLLTYEKTGIIYIDSRYIICYIRYNNSSNQEMRHD